MRFAAWLKDSVWAPVLAISVSAGWVKLFAARRLDGSIVDWPCWLIAADH